MSQQKQLDPGTAGGRPGQGGSGPHSGGRWGQEGITSHKSGAQACADTKGEAFRKQEAGPWSHPGLQGAPVSGLPAASS